MNMNSGGGGGGGCIRASTLSFFALVAIYNGVDSQHILTHHGSPERHVMVRGSGLLSPSLNKTAATLDQFL